MLSDNRELQDNREMNTGDNKPLGERLIVQAERILRNEGWDAQVHSMRDVTNRVYGLDCKRFILLARKSPWQNIASVHAMAYRMARQEAKPMIIFFSEWWNKKLKKKDFQVFTETTFDRIDTYSKGTNNNYGSLMLNFETHALGRISPGAVCEIGIYQQLKFA